MLELGEFIKEKRLSAGLSFKKLSIASDVSDSEIKRIENGTRKIQAGTPYAKLQRLWTSTPLRYC